MIVLPLLFLLATAEAVWSPPSWPPSDVTEPYYRGDELNITQCYCGRTNEDKIYGHYYQFDYRNYANGREYTLAWTCDSDVSIEVVGTIGSKTAIFSVPDCWIASNSWRKEKRKECNRYYNRDTFCYETGDTADPYDHYYFNGEMRELPTFGIREFPPHQCATLCRDKVGGKAVAGECKFQSRYSLIKPLVLTRKTCPASGFSPQTCLKA